MLEKSPKSKTQKYCVMLSNNSVKADNKKKALYWPEAHSWWFLKLFPG